MKLERSTDWFTGAKTWSLTITPHEFVAIEWRAGDRLLLNECEGPDASTADVLLGLELIARRIQESA